MRSPIVYAMQAEPRLESGIPWLELAQTQPLEFQAIDEVRFPAMALVKSVLAGEDSLAIALNAANEVANQAFQDGLIGFMDIVSMVERVLEKTSNQHVKSLEEVWMLDKEARQMANIQVQTC